MISIVLLVLLLLSFLDVIQICVSEYLKAICESFLISFEICQLPQVRCTQGQVLDKRKSKLINETLSDAMYLNVVGIPPMTRNVSESQLLVLKNVGELIR